MKKIYSYIFSIGAISILIFFYNLHKDTNNYSLEVSSFIKDCSGSAELYINSLTIQPETSKIICNTTSLLKFKLKDNISFIRLDLGNSANNEIKVNELIIFKNNEIIDRLNGNSLKDWKTNDVKIKSIDKDSISYITIGPDPFIYNYLNINIGKSLNFIPQEIINIFNRYSIYILSLICILLLITFVKFSSTMFEGKVILITFLSLVCCLNLFKSLNINPVNDEAVGIASYLGFNYLNFIIPLFSSLIPVLIYIYYRKEKFKNNRIDIERRQKTINVYAIPSQFIILIILTLFFSINPYEISNSNNTIIVNPDWDGNNILYWNYLIKSGYLPYKDFWYPYFGHSLFDIGNGYGELIYSVYKIILFFNLFLLLNLILRKSLLFNVFVLATIILLNNHIFWGADRYLLSIIFVLSVLTFINNKESFSSHYLIISSFALVLVIDTPQLIYSLLTLLAIFILNLFYLGKLYITENKIKIYLLLSYFSSTLIIVLIYLQYHSMLNGVTDFLSTLGSMAIYSQVPRDIENIFVTFFSLNTVWILGPILLFSLSICRYYNKSIIDGQYLIAVSILLLFLLNKHIIRSLDSQMLIFFFVWGIIYLESLNFHEKYTKILIYLILIIVIVTKLNLDSLFQKLLLGPNNILMSAKFFLNDNEFQTKFNESNLVNFNKDIKFLDDYSRRFGYKPEFYTFSDNQILYILANQSPFYNNNIYNQSPIKDQLKTIAQLDNRKTEYIVIDSNQIMFDSVPNYVRLPLVFSYIVNHYSYLYKFNNFYVFKRGNIEPKKMLYKLTEIYGNRVDLKYLPTFTSKSRDLICNANCDKYLKIDITNVTNKANNSISFKIDNQIFTLDFIVQGYKNSYYINVKNVWFIDFALTKNLEIELISPINQEYINFKNEKNLLY